MGYLAAFIVVVMLTAGIYLFGYAARKTSLLYVLLLETVIGLVFIFPLLLWLDHLSITLIFTTAHKENWYWLTAAALFGYVGGNYFSLMNLKAVGEKSNSLLSPAITATVIVLSFFIFDEKLLGRQWVGIFLVLTSVVYFLLRSKTTILLNKKNTGFTSGLLCVIFISLTIICSIKGANSNITLLQAIWIRLLLALIFILIGIPFIKEKVILKKHPLKFYMMVIFGVICQTIVANYLWFYSSFHLGIAVFQLILATLPLCVYAVDVYILKKSANAPLFLLVSIITAVGVCLVVL